MPPPGGPCRECGFDPSKVSPADAAVAARSFPRRFRALLVRPDEDDPEIVHRRPAGGGPSAAGHALAAASGMDAAATALARVRVAVDPAVDLGPRPAPSRLPLEAVLDQVAAAAGALATTVESMHGEEWSRPGRLPDGGRVTALDVARAGVHAGVHHLRAAERTLSEVR
jgi:hypothetical protein